MHGSYCRGTVTGEGSNHNSGYFFVKYFCNTYFCFVLCIHFSSFMQFTFDVCL